MAPNKNETIEKTKIVLTEGKDALYFAVNIINHFDIPYIQVVDSGGVNNLTNSLETFKKRENYEIVDSMLILRDAETDFDAAFRSVTDSLQSVGLSAPSKTFQFFDGANPRTAIALFPAFGKDENGNITSENGTLEDLCWSIISEKPEIPCIESFLNDVEKSSSIKLRRPHKNKLHSYLSATNQYVGMKIGEATKIGAWGWTHPKMQNFVELLRQM